MVGLELLHFGSLGSTHGQAVGVCEMRVCLCGSVGIRAGLVRCHYPPPTSETRSRWQNPARARAHTHTLTHNTTPPNKRQQRSSGDSVSASRWNGARLSPWQPRSIRPKKEKKQKGVFAFKETEAEYARWTHTGHCELSVITNWSLNCVQMPNSPCFRFSRLFKTIQQHCLRKLNV